MQTLISTSESKLYVVDNFISEKMCNHILEELENLELVKRPKLFIHGKIAQMNRNVAFLSEEVEEYPYSGQKMKSQSFSNCKTIKKCLKRTNKFIKLVSKENLKYNGILINEYLDGNDYIGPHSDNEVVLSHNDGASLGVVAISLGTSRIFRIRDKITKSKILDVATKNGQLIYMEGNFQKEFTHEIPKQLKIKEKRTSLTFRNH